MDTSLQLLNSLFFLLVITIIFVLKCSPYEIVIFLTTEKFQMAIYLYSLSLIEFYLFVLMIYT